MDVSDELLRHLYRYDRSLPLLSTSEPEAPLDPRTHAPVEGLRGERVTFASTHDERVLASLYRPAEGGPFPAIVLQHGSTPLGRHGWSRYALGEDGVPLPVAWARSGFVVVAVDALGFGSREGPDDRGRLRRGRPDLLFRTRDQRMQAVQDLMRTVDYLESRADVRSDAIALAGVSMGCRVGVPCFALDGRLRAAAFFVAGAGPYSRFDIAEGGPAARG